MSFGEAIKGKFGGNGQKPDVKQSILMRANLLIQQDLGLNKVRVGAQAEIAKQEQLLEAVNVNAQRIVGAYNELKLLAENLGIELPDPRAAAAAAEAPKAEAPNAPSEPSNS